MQNEQLETNDELDLEINRHFFPQPGRKSYLMRASLIIAGRVRVLVLTVALILVLLRFALFYLVALY